jgi:Cu2+-containing amine oxidase
MKFIVLFLLAIASAASHAMWVTVTRNEVATVYIDSSAITKLGYNRRVWVVYDLTSPDKTGQQSVKSHIDYDCTEGKYRTISATSHPNKMGNGPAIKALPVPEGWRPVSQDSMSRQLFAFACAW